MSVFTSVSIQELQAWLQDYAIGEVVELKGISAGITNTNYFVTTTKDKYVLTLFEQNSMDELPYFIDLMSYLSTHGVPCPGSASRTDPATAATGSSSRRAPVAGGWRCRSQNAPS